MNLLRWLSGLAFSVLTAAGVCGRAASDRPPNVVLLFADDLGYGDLGCYGRRDIRTPHLDRLAAGGLRYTDFCVAQAVCSASRAALLTGCLPNRIGIQGALMPRSPAGLHPNEVTLGELFQSRGYATAAVGKWHLGDAPAFNPLRHGFDEWFGLPYSNDMWPSHPTRKDFPALPLMDGTAVVDAEVTPEDQPALTARYTDRAVSFIRRSAGRPFFLYLAYSMPHVPLFASEAFRGHSAAGRYGDVLEELDTSAGRIMDAIRTAGLEAETVVIFTSDNGPWLVYGDHAGVTGGLREGKGTSWEGGVRVPCIVSWPGRIPAGRVTPSFAATVDLFPTLAALIGAPLPAGRILDGHSLAGSWTNVSGSIPERPPFPGYYGGALNSMRHGPWKRVLPHAYQSLVRAGGGGLPGVYEARQTPAALYRLDRDPGEAGDVSGEFPERVAALDAALAGVRESLGDSNVRAAGNALRPAGSAAALLAVQSPDGFIRLGATNAIVHGVDVRAETGTDTARIAAWGRGSDWVEWDFEVTRPGRFLIDLVPASGGLPPPDPLEARVNGQRLQWPLPKGTPTSAHGVEFFVPGRYVLHLRRTGAASGTGDSLSGLILRPQ